STKTQHRISKMLILVLNLMVIASLLASDFPSENPRTQNRTFHMHNRYPTFENRNLQIEFKVYNEIIKN
ncbi:hypothetical protein, partial [Thalassobellus citreus]|uniref:hypothetical protein n=1 Tax=Thalassobellus citreus TaxID=3367752 RepID=UPI00378B2E35